MVYRIGAQNYNYDRAQRAVSFGKEEKAKGGACENKDMLLVGEDAKSSIAITAEKLKNACTTYPLKGLSGSKNANFYEFLTMGMVPYLTGSATMIAVFNLASKYFNTPAMMSSSAIGKKMGLGVLFYGVGKTLSKKLIEVPLGLKYGIKNVNYKKVVHELPEERNKDNLVTYEYHKAFESVDFPRWDLFYGNENYGKERNAWFKKVAKKMGFKDEDTSYADQKTKALIREKLVQSRVFSTVSSYFWAALGVAVANQKPWENLKFNNMYKYDLKKFPNLVADFAKNFAVDFKQSCKELVTVGENTTKANAVAGKILVGLAVGSTLLGNFMILSNFNKDKGSKTEASTSLIDNGKEKVVC